ncbi:hypothetical protein HGG75_26720 [Ochrobactrum pseudogrignonense]|nr:hypothetical protein [Brucella pseudogrignonensis]
MLETPGAYRRFIIKLGLAFAGLALLLSHPARAEIVITDAAGRTVRLEAPAKRIVTNESLLLLSLALIDPDPVSLIAGWANPQRIDPGMLAAFRAKFPAIDAIPTVGALQPTQTSVESILSAGRIWLSSISGNRAGRRSSICLHPPPFPSSSWMAR